MFSGSSCTQASSAPGCLASTAATCSPGNGYSSSTRTSATSCTARSRRAAASSKYSLPATSTTRRAPADSSGSSISGRNPVPGPNRSEEHTSELQSLMRISYAVFCLKKKTINETRSTNKTSIVHNENNDNRAEHTQNSNKHRHEDHVSRKH